MANRPIGRSKRVTGSGSVNRRGSGLGTGSVGGGHVPSSGGGYKGERNGGGGGRGPIGTIIILALMLIFGGGSLGSFLGTSSTSSTDTDFDTSSITSIFSNPSANSTASNYSWSSDSNVGILDKSVARSAREKYTSILGDGKDVYTIMVYMCGTDLESRCGMATKDMQEMLNANIADNVNLLVYTGGCSAWKNNIVSSKTNQIYQINAGKLNLVKDNIGDLTMTDPNTLSSFIQWGAKNYPANRYGLILWDHGSGSVSGYGYDEKHPNAGSMGLTNINKALTSAGIKYDFVGFDACLMATVETGLMLSNHSDYMIASEETEPGIGWYYTNWLTSLSNDTSKSILDFGQIIIDDFVSECASACPGQKTTLSLVDLAELSATAPEDLKSFSTSTSELIEEQNYQTVSTARTSAREFAASSRIDQIDLIDFALKMDSDEGKELAETLKGAVKYNNTSSNMTNAYGLSIYFPYRSTGKVDNMLSTYDEIGMDDSYGQCIQKFASVAYYGQAAGAQTGSTNPASVLFGSNSSSLDSAQAIMEILNAFVVNDGRSHDFLNNGVDIETAAKYIADNNISADDLQWTKNDAGDNAIILTEDQWEKVSNVDLSVFVDDGTGYIDLGLDNIYEWDEDDNLIAPTDRSWIAIDNQIVAYYHIDTTGDEDNYTITGRVPCFLNGQEANLILVFDTDHEYGYVAGASFDYKEGVDVVAKNLTELEPGDTIDFVCDHYSYDGDYSDSYYLGEQMEIEKSMSEMTITNMAIEEKDILISYVFTDLYGNNYYTEGIGQ